MRYNTIRNYKKFKCEYKEFVLFIKYGKYYYTYDSDAKIMMFVYNKYNKNLIYKIEKTEFKNVLKTLHGLGLNVVLAGYKNSQEYYTNKMSEYQNIKKKSKIYYKSTKSSENNIL